MLTRRGISGVVIVQEHEDPRFVAVDAMTAAAGGRGGGGEDLLGLRCGSGGGDGGEKDVTTTFLAGCCFLLCLASFTQTRYPGGFRRGRGEEGREKERKRETYNIEENQRERKRR